MKCERRFSILPLLPILCAAWLPASAEQAKLLQETSLRPAPEATERSAFLTPDTPIELLELRDGWARVRIEGWVPAEAVAPSTAPPAAMVPPIPAVAAVTPPSTAATGVPVEGIIRIKLGRFNKKTGAGAPVMLVPAGVDLAGNGLTEDEAQRLETLETELNRLQELIEKAMQNTNFTDAVQQRDALKREREGLLADRRDILAAQHGRHEQTARLAAVASAVADSKGWFRLATVPSGRYTLYARMTTDELDLEWAEGLTVGSTPVSLDLDEQSARGLLSE